MMSFCFLGCGPHTLATICRIIDIDLNRNLRILVVDQRDNFNWHPGLLLPHVTMQISFLKDLVSQVDPKSQFSFLNFLSETGKLSEFTNLSTLYPYRMEFRNYLKWVVSRLETFGVKFLFKTFITSINFLKNNKIQISLKTETIVTDFLQISIGGIPNIPLWINDYWPSDRVTHSEKFVGTLEKFSDLKRHNLRFGIIGGGQSSIEMLNALRQEFPECIVDIIIRRSYFQEYTTNKFSNKIFMPSHIEEFFNLSIESKLILNEEYRFTNYSGVNSSDLENLYRTLYCENLIGNRKINLHCNSEVDNFQQNGSTCQLVVRNRLHEEITQLDFDHLFLGTGYTNSLQIALARIKIEEISSDAYVDECFQLLDSKKIPSIFCMGHNEATHGIQDVLVSNVAFKANKVCDRLISLIG